MTYNKILENILEEYNRIYKESVYREKNDISKKIVNKLVDMLYEIIFKKNNNALIGQFIGTPEHQNYRYNYYYEFLKIAIEKKDSSRFNLIYLIFAIIKHAINQKIDEKNLDYFLTNSLFQINKLIIDNNDFELFKVQINHFSRSIIFSPSWIQEEIIEKLYDLEIKFYYIPNIDEKTNYLLFLTKYKLAKEYGDYGTVNGELDKYESYIKTEITKLEDKGKIKHDSNNNLNESINEIRYQLRRYYISSLLYRTFFMVGSYIIFLNRENKIEGSKYIEELWMHTNRENQGMRWLNETPVEHDFFWLFNLYLFGGINNGFWTNELSYQIEDFRDIKSYAIQYLILILVKFYDPSKKLSGFQSNKSYESGEFYNLITKIRYKHEELIKNLEILNTEGSNWANLLKPELEKKFKITIINDERIFEVAKELIINAIFKELEISEKELERKLPLDNEKVRHAKQKILNSYNNSSKLPELFEYKKYYEITYLGKSFLPKSYIKMGYRPIYPKDCLIKNSSIDCNDLWNNISRVIIRGEEEYCLERILANINIKITKLNKTNTLDIYEKIKEISKYLLNKSFKPNLLFLPLEIYTNFLLENGNGRSPLFDKINRNDFLDIDADIKLKVITSHDYLKFDEIIIMDKNLINWFYEPDCRTNERLWVDINQDTEDLSKVDVCIRTKLKIDVVNSECIEIIKFKN